MSGVSEQMKLTGNTGKNVEERNIPWSQQVDEASYENLASPNVDDNTAAHQSSMQFQYPPFNIKDNQNFSWNDRSRKPSNNFDNSKKYGKPVFQNSKRDDVQPNVWNSQNTRRIISDNPSGNFNRANRLEDSKLDNRSISLASVEERKIAPTVAAPKKTTWASIASQPAKLTSRTTLMTSSHKKKGPGMPPPPMVPGKHNLDVNTWDVPNNNPPPVPSPPPPIDLASVEINPDFSTPIGSDHLDLGARPEKGHKVNDYSKDDNKSNYNNSNFGRVRNSPNGHSRKNWSTQHPLHQNRQTIAGNSMGINRQNDRQNDSGNGGLNRYIDRRSQFNSLRREPENTSHDFRDENSPRNVETVSNIKEISTESPQAVIDELRDKNNYNPSEIDLEKATKSRFFVIKSYSEDDIHRSIKYEIWCSTDHGNKRLDDAFKERHTEGGHILLFFSVNGSGHFCGMAQMMTAVDYNSTSNVWSQDKWKGKFKVKWIYVKDVPNTMLRNIYLENNDNKPVTKSRDTQEVPNARGIEVLQIVHKYNHTTSIFDDFYHYEERQEKEVSSKKPFAHDTMRHSQNRSPINRGFNVRQIGDRERYRDRDNRGNGAQKYYSGNNGGGSGGNGGGGGGGTSIGGAGNNFRDRNNSHRASYHNNYNDRRFEIHRSGMGPNDYQQKDKDTDNDRENNDYGSRHNQRFDYNRRDDTTQSKQNARERDFSEDYNKTDTRFRPGAREMHKDNEYHNSDRTRSKTDY